MSITWNESDLPEDSGSALTHKQLGSIPTVHVQILCQPHTKHALLKNRMWCSLQTIGLCTGTETCKAYHMHFLQLCKVLIGKKETGQIKILILSSFFLCSKPLSEVRKCALKADSSICSSILFSSLRARYCTSVCSRASAAGCACDCELVIGTNSLGESNCFIGLYFNVELLAFEGKQRFISAFPLLECILVVTIVGAYFTANTFALCAQTLSGWRHKKPITSCPTHFEAAVCFLHYTETSGLVSEWEWGVCKGM